MKINAIQWGGIAILSLILIVYFGGYKEVVMRPDSGGYINLAHSIVTGDIFVKQDLKDVTFSRAIRTPGYPLILAVATLGDRGNINNTLLAHLFIALFSVIFLSWKLRGMCPPLITASVVALIELLMRDYFAVMMTEFVAFNCLLIVFGLAAAAFEKPTFRNIFLVGLISALAVLVRPALAPALLVMPSLVLYRWWIGRKIGLARSGLLASTLLPIIMWMSFNLYYIEAFTLTQVGGLNAYGIGSQLGYAEPEPGDSEELKVFIAEMNVKKTPPKGQEDAHIANLNEDYKFLLLSNTLWVTHKMRRELGTIPLDREYLGPYGRRAIRDNLGNYVKYVAYGMTLFFSFGFPMAALVFLVVPLAGVYRKKNLPLSYATLVMFGVHFTSGLLASGYEAVWDRYIILSYYPYTAAIIVCFFGLLCAEEVDEKLARILPTWVVNLTRKVFS